MSGSYDFEDFEMQDSVSNEQRDRLSELPDVLIFHILSFLPMRDVVKTTLLSKHWKDLWTTLPCLIFRDYIDDPVRIRNFVNRALMLWEGTKILKFETNFYSYFDLSLSRDPDLWVRFAKKNKVEELYICLSYDDYEMIMDGEDAAYWAPQCLYSCSSIKKLSLLGCYLKIHGSLHLDQLKSLSIDRFCLGEHVINQVLSGAPRLEILMLRFIESYENLNAHSSGLKKLTIEKDLYHGDDPSTDTVLRIWSPNLETLKISGVLYRKYLLMNVSSLTDATLGFYGPWHYDNGVLSLKELLGETLMQIFPSIQHVEKVLLSDWCIKVLGALEKRRLFSPLLNVKFRTLDVRIIELDKVVDLLEIFPT